MTDFRSPVAVPDWLWAELTDDQKASGMYVRLNPLPPPESDKPVRYTNRAARREESRRA
jgi:hypothetical protein